MSMFTEVRRVSLGGGQIHVTLRARDAGDFRTFTCVLDATANDAEIASAAVSAMQVKFKELHEKHRRSLAQFIPNPAAA
jgi:hypothetical protein